MKQSITSNDNSQSTTNVVPVEYDEIIESQLHSLEVKLAELLVDFGGLEGALANGHKFQEVRVAYYVAKDPAFAKDLASFRNSAADRIVVINLPEPTPYETEETQQRRKTSVPQKPSSQNQKKSTISQTLTTQQPNTHRLNTTYENKNTKKHIKDGKYCNAQSCPVSLAIRDALGLDLGQVAVYGDKCRAVDTYLDLPNQVDAFVNRLTSRKSQAVKKN
jgi:hypothetical protein